jgi:hypothetical protein
VRRAVSASSGHLARGLLPARVRLRRLGGLVGRVFCPAAARRRRLLPREWSVGAGRRYGDKHERCATRPAAGAVMGVAASGSGVAAGNAPLGQGHGARKGGAQGRPFCEMIYCRFPISIYHIKIVIILITICWKCVLLAHNAPILTTITQLCSNHHQSSVTVFNKKLLCHHTCCATNVSSSSFFSQCRARNSYK